MAEVVIGIGPGFTVGIDCDYVIETMRGHNLAKIYEKDGAIENTGVPGLIVSYDKDRVIYSPITGIFHNKHKIGDVVKKNEVISVIEEVIDGKSSGRFVELKASIEGLLRGILRDGFYATSGLKVADIDPRYSEYYNCFTISDKARSIGAAVVTTIMHIYNK